VIRRGRHSIPLVWTWQGMVALVVAVNVSLAWAVVLVIGMVSDQPVSDAGRNMIETIGGGLITIVAGYMGYQVGAATTAAAQEEEAE
jgi:hypothetical protein